MFWLRLWDERALLIECIHYAICWERHEWARESVLPRHLHKQAELLQPSKTAGVCLECICCVDICFACALTFFHEGLCSKPRSSLLHQCIIFKPFTLSYVAMYHYTEIFRMSCHAWHASDVGILDGSQFGRCHYSYIAHCYSYVYFEKSWI